MKFKHKPDNERPGRPWEHPYRERTPWTTEVYNKAVETQPPGFTPIVPNKLSTTSLYSSLTSVKYPVLATPLVRGMRCLTMEGGRAVDEHMADIPNEFIRETMLQYGMGGLDGVITIAGEMDKAVIVDAVMDKHDAPMFEYHVFDLWAMSIEDYDDRVADLARLLPKPRPHMIRVLSPSDVYDVDGLVRYWNKCVDDGHEGVAIRAPEGKYTRHGQPAPIGMLDILSKRVEGTGSIRSALGGKHGLDAFVVVDKVGQETIVECGYTDEQRDFYWKTKKQHVGYDLTYSYNPGGKQPRNPVFISTTAR